MFEKWRAPKPKVTEGGPSVPTISAALENDKDLARLIPEIAKMDAGDRTAFAEGITRAIEDLKLDKPLPSNTEDFLKAYGAAGVGMTLAVAIGSFLIGPPAGLAPYVGAAVAGAEVNRHYMGNEKRSKEEIVRRLNLLRDILTQHA